MDCLPGTPQIQNIIPTTFFHTTIYAAPILGTLGAIYILIIGMTYLEWCRHRAHAAGEGYGTGHINETVIEDTGKLVNPLIAISPLFAVGIANWVMTKKMIPYLYGASSSIMLNPTAKPIVQDVTKLNGIWSVETALLIGILLVVIFGFGRVGKQFAEGSKSAIAGALLASLNTASEYGFGAVIAALPGFLVVRDALAHIPNPLVNEAVSVNILAGITGSASGGMSIALAAMANQFIAAANAHGIPMEVLHRVAAMASGGMDTMPHNGAVITLLMVTGLTHRQSYKDVFAMTCIKTSAVFVIIALFYLTHLV
jgi:H+/gluconate symporter-like permease